ncbi:MAG TPA: hypothetical protein VJ873_01215 [bacterium]|nr:hypothetical protein [bacterium]
MADNRQNQKDPQKRFSRFEEYLYANLLWWAFLIVLAIISYFTCGGVWDDITSGVMEFIFVILGGGFTLVSVLDYVYDSTVSRGAVEGKK